jgi:alkaline phosphatase D
MRILGEPKPRQTGKFSSKGYAIVTADAERIASEFVCIPRPITSAPTPDGGPLRYRVVHSAARWQAGEKPRLAQSVIEGDVSLSI